MKRKTITASAWHKLTVGIGLLTGAVFLWLALRHVDFRSVSDAMRNANFWVVLPFILSLVLFYWLKALRWAALLRPTKIVTAGDLAPSMMIGFAGNNLLPVRLGELLRIYILSKQQSLSKSLVLATIVLERLFDTVSVLILLALAMHVAPVTSEGFEAVRSLLTIVVTLALIAVYGIVFTPNWLKQLAGTLLALFPSGLSTWVNSKFGEVQDGFAALRTRRAILKIFVNSIVQWTLLALCIFFSIKAFGVDVGPAAAILVLGLVVAGISIPAAPGFVGTIEYCFVLGLGFFGVDANEALGIGLFYHALNFGFVTLAGFFYLRYYNISLFGLRQEVTAITDYDR